MKIETSRLFVKILLSIASVAVVVALIFGMFFDEPFQFSSYSFPIIITLSVWLIYFVTSPRGKRENLGK